MIIYRLNLLFATIFWARLNLEFRSLFIFFSTMFDCLIFSWIFYILIVWWLGNNMSCGCKSTNYLKVTLRIYKQGEWWFCVDTLFIASSRWIFCRKQIKNFLGNLCKMSNNRQNTKKRTIYIMEWKTLCGNQYHEFYKGKLFIYYKINVDSISSINYLVFPSIFCKRMVKIVLV